MDITYLIWLALPAFLSYSWYKYRGLEYIIFNYRWIFVVLFLLPLSLIYDLVFFIRNWIVFRMSSAPYKHAEKVQDVQRQVLSWRADGASSQMCTARPGWMSVCIRVGKYKTVMRNISVNLVDILEVDATRRIVRVEPLATMGQMTAALTPLGWTLPIVPELDDLTVGGLIMGVGIETSSLKYGLMQHVCESFELVLSDGSVAKCSRTENPDLFYVVPWSHGTIGFLVSVELRIIPARKYVRLTYEPAYTLDEAIVKFEAASAPEADFDFVEGLMYSRDTAVIMSGVMTDDAVPEQINCIGRYYKPWFFKHAESVLQKGPCVEYIPLCDYYKRHMKGIFWTMQDIIPFGNNALFRVLFGWMVPPKISLLKLTQGETIKNMYEKYQVIQDMLVPMESLKESLLCFDREIDMYPLWLCPFRLFNQPGFVHPSTEDADQMYVDIGAYGAPRVPNYNSKQTVRRLEKFVASVNGFQMLYGDSFMTRGEFREMFDHTLYDKMRARLNCVSAFPEIYDKVNRTARQ